MHQTMERLYKAAQRDTRGAIFTKNKLADALGVSRQTIYRWERDGIPREFAIKAAKLISCTFEWIFFGEKEKLAPEIQRVIDLMLDADQRAREKIVIAVKDALEAHQAWRNSLPPSATIQETVEEFIKKKAAETLADIRQNNNKYISDNCIHDYEISDFRDQCPTRSYAARDLKST